MIVQGPDLQIKPRGCECEYEFFFEISEKSSDVKISKKKDSILTRTPKIGSKFPYKDRMSSKTQAKSTIDLVKRMRINKSAKMVETHASTSRFSNAVFILGVRN